MDENIIEKRLNEIDETLKEILKRVEKIEKSLGFSSGEATLAVMLANTLGLSAIEAIKAALRARRALNKLRFIDPISRAIIEVLSKGDWMNISEITRVVKLIRGRASRSVIREKIKKLEKTNIVEVERKGNRTLVRLKESE